MTAIRTRTIISFALMAFFNKENKMEMRERFILKKKLEEMVEVDRETKERTYMPFSSKDLLKFLQKDGEYKDLTPHILTKILNTMNLAKKRYGMTIFYSIVGDEQFFK